MDCELLQFYSNKMCTMFFHSDITLPNNIAVPPIVQHHFIVVIWHPPCGEEFVMNYILVYTSVSRVDQQITGSNITISRTQTFYNFTFPLLKPYSNYTFVVFANFGDGEVAQVVSPFRAASQEAGRFKENAYVHIENA